jgi:peroxiredoxin
MPAVLLNQPAPDFALPDLEGRLVRLGQLRGQVVVLNFWSAECPWAERTDRELQAYSEAWGARVVVLRIASNANEPDEILRAASQTRNLALILKDSAAQVAELYAAQTTPHLFVVDAEGFLRYRGAFDDVTFRQRAPTRFFLREAVDAILAGRPPDPAETPAYGCTIVREI